MLLRPCFATPMAGAALNPGGPMPRWTLVALTVAATSFTAARPAHAFFSLGDFKLPAPSLGPEFVVAGVVVMAGIVIPTLVAAAKAGSAAGRGERPSSGWLAMGYIGSAVLLSSGLMSLAMSKGDSMGVGLGALTAAVGATTLGFTIWGSTQPAKKTTLDLIPVVGQGAKGAMFGGIGQRLAMF